MDITYDPELVRQNDNDQTVYFILIDDNLSEYQWHCDVPQGVDIQAYLNSNMRGFLRLIRCREYPGINQAGASNRQTLRGVEDWIATYGKDRIPFNSTHPGDLTTITDVSTRGVIRKIWSKIW